LDANVQNSSQILDEVTSLLLPIKKAWASIPEDAKEEAYKIQRRKSRLV
jgi:flagellar protein FliS